MPAISDQDPLESPSALADDDFDVAPTAKIRAKWAFNGRLLMVTAIVLIALLSCFAGLYWAQSRRLTIGMLDRADAAASASKPADEIRWLVRYVRMKPDDVQAITRLAKAADLQASQDGSGEFARQQLALAVSALSSNPVHSRQLLEVKHLYIERLLKLGGTRCIEAEQQIFSLKPAPDDAKAWKWMATAIFYQRLLAGAQGNWNTKTSKAYDRDRDFWKWVASQPLGYIISQARSFNPNDFELSSFYLSIVADFASELKMPEDLEIDPIDFDAEAQQVLKAFVAQVDNGRAQWAAFVFERIKNPANALKIVSDAYPAAIERLQSKQPEPDAINYDWLLVLAAAETKLNSKEYTGALELLNALVQLPPEKTNQRLLEQTFEDLGRGYWQLSRQEEAIAAWNEGLTRTPNSLTLGGALARAAQLRGSLEELKSVAAKYRNIVATRSAMLDGAEGASLDRVARDDLRQRVQVSRWQSLVLDGQLALAEGDLQNASDKLSRAFDSPLAVSVEDRVIAGRLLAETYGKRQLWDMAAQTLERCGALDPQNLAVRRLTADAWLQLGSAEQAGEQLERLDDGSFEAAYDIARLTAFAELAKPVELQDESKIRAALDALKQRASKDVALVEPWRVEMLEISIADMQADARKDNQRGLDVTQQLVALAEKYPLEEQVQSFAAITLASNKQVEPARKCLERLRSKLEDKGDVGKATLTLVSALIMESEGQAAAAQEMIEEAVSATPSQALKLAKAGAQMALRNRQPASAMRVVQLVPEDKWDASTFQIACQIGLASPELKSRIKEADFDRWEGRIRELEGDASCTWRAVAVTRLLRKYSQNNISADVLSKAEAHVREIERLRPKWGKGSALAGQIAALRGDHAKAVDHLRVATRNGDSSASTLVLLVTELVAANRISEAEQELRRLSQLPEDVVPVTEWSVAMAQSRGDLRSALDIARRAADSSDKDWKAWMIVYQAAIAMADSRSINKTEQMALKAEAWNALELATQYSQGKQPDVWNARIGFLLAANEKDKVKAELTAMEKILTPDVGKLVAALGLLQIGDVAAAQIKAQEAIAANPQNSKAHLTMAQVLQQIGDKEGMLSELEAAVELDPQNIDLREKLALTYTVSGDDIPWSKFDTVLSDSAIAASPKSRLLRAVLSLARGDLARRDEARKTLTQIAASGSDIAVLAKRALAKDSARRWFSLPAADRSGVEGTRLFTETKQILEDLVRSKNPSVEDLAMLSSLMMDNGQYADAEDVANRLPASAYALRLRLALKLAKLRGDPIDAVTEKWASSASGFSQEEVWDFAGRTLLELNFENESLAWLEKSYKQNPDKYLPYAVALAHADKSKEAIDICLQRLKNDDSPEAAGALVEVALAQPDTWNAVEVDEAMRKALTKYPDSPALLEVAGTLRLMQSNYAEAATLLNKALALSPNRLRTLNNLAIAQSELADKRKEAITHIDRALTIAGRQPELLDTLALVQVKNSMLKEAKLTLEEVLRKAEQPRYQARMAYVLLEMGDNQPAQSLWNSIDQAKLQEEEFPPVDQPMMQLLASELGAKP